MHDSGTLLGGARLKPHFLEPLLRSGSAALLLRNTRTGLPVASALEPAFESSSRRRGLLGREGLPSDHAILLAPCSVVHTCFMRFAIDVLVTGRDGTVLKAVRSVHPWRMVGTPRGFAVIEMAEGGLAASGTVRGDRLMLDIARKP